MEVINHFKKTSVTRIPYFLLYRIDFNKKIDELYNLGGSRIFSVIK